MNLKHALNKTSLHAYTKLEVDVLGVPKKLVKYVTCLKEKLKKKLKTSDKLSKLQLISYWSQRILGVKKRFRS
jgi:hypothetical protein